MITLSPGVNQCIFYKDETNQIGLINSDVFNIYQDVKQTFSLLNINTTPLIFNSPDYDMALIEVVNNISLQDLPNGIIYLPQAGLYFLSIVSPGNYGTQIAKEVLFYNYQQNIWNY